ncbi:Aste57867_11416 [Aphanomyces stellatus]|uniref:Aste57867_11416 protein n=1 Tax=Aphanomyces stellatus TaxID=120398 RepID=A0A485KTC5_9STRA|nr:hypothetical protein As57867_011374 [Aphanomyces stellatus]VFT88277.1 Aste57867_11416 [Aphanomyces stellatus]
MPHSCRLAIALVGVIPSIVYGYYDFTKKIPNGLNIPGESSAGHSGRGQLNRFGFDFHAAKFRWTTELCEKDSDGDGATNGEELGDPCCVWQVGWAPDTNTVSPPGTPNKFSSDDLAKLKCEKRRRVVS